MSAMGIRAGKAFVEMLIDDESVAASLEEVKTKLRTFGAAVDATAGRSFVAMNATASTTLASTGASVGVLAATIGVLRASVYTVAVAFRVVFAQISGSVTRAVIGLGLVGLAVAKFAPKGGAISNLLSGFLTNSQTTEAVGRWTRFFGVLTGSSAIKGLGNQIERLGLGSAVLRGFRSGGLLGGIGATFGAAFRSSKSIVASGIVSLFTGPISVVRGMLGTVMSSAGGGGGGGLKSLAGATGGITSGLTSATGAARTFGATSAIFSNVATAARGLALKVVGLAAAITGPALLAAKKFVASSVEISDEAKKTGKSLDELISAKYGENSLISRNDIAAGAALGAVMKELKSAMAAAWAQIGAAALPVLRGITENMLWAAGATTQLLGRNRELVATVVRVAAQVGSAAAAFLLLYTAFPLIVAGIGMVLSPMGLMAAGVLLVAYAFPQLLAEARSVFGFLTTNFGELGTIVSTTMGGIADALAGGNIQAAARVLMAGINVAWLAGTEQLRAVWRNMQTALASGLINLGATLNQIWVSALSGMVTAWRSTQNVLAGGFARVIAMSTGQDVNEVLATLTEMQDAEAKGVDDSFKKRMEGIEAARQATLESLDEEAAARNALADKGLADARQELIDARTAAAEIKPKKIDKPEASALGGAATSLGSFSTAGLRGVGGGMGKVEDNTRRTAVATEKLAAKSGTPLLVGT